MLHAAASPDPRSVARSEPASSVVSSHARESCARSLRTFSTDWQRALTLDLASSTAETIVLMALLVVLCSKTCAQPCGRPRQRMQCKHAGSKAYVNTLWTSSHRDHRLLAKNCSASDLRRHHIVSLVHFEYARVSGTLRRCLLQASTLNSCACVGVVQACNDCSYFIEMYFSRLRRLKSS